MSENGITYLRVVVDGKKLMKVAGKDVSLYFLLCEGLNSETVEREIYGEDVEGNE